MGINLNKINNIYYIIGKKIIVYRWLCILLTLVFIAFSISQLKNLDTDNSNNNWFLDNDPVKIAKDKFEDTFGNTDFVAVLVTVDDIFKPQNLKLIRNLSDELDKNVPFSDDILSITNSEFILGTDYGMEIIDLIPEKIPTDKKKLEKIKKLALSKKSMVDKLYSADGKEAWILLRLKEFPDDWKSNKEYKKYYESISDKYPDLKPAKGKDVVNPNLLVAYAAKSIIDQEKYKVLNPNTAGMPNLNYNKRLWINGETKRLFILSIILAMLILIIFLRSFRGVIFPLLSAVISLLGVFGIEGLFHTTFDPTVMCIPLFLGIAVSVGYSIHICTYYKRYLRMQFTPRIAAILSVKETGWPILFTALTTIAAMLSFLFIDVKMLRWVGITSALLVAITYIITMILLPALLSFGKIKKRHAKQNTFKNSLGEKNMLKLSEFVLNHSNSILIIFIIASLIFIYGSLSLKVAFDVEKTMGSKIPYVKNLLAVGNSQIGSIYSYNLVVKFPQKGDAKKAENLAKLDLLNQQVKSYPLVKKTTSILDIIKDLNQVLNSGEQKFYKLPEITDIEYYKSQDLTIDERKEIEQQIMSQTMLLYENAGGSEAEKWLDYNEQQFYISIELSNYSSDVLEVQLEDIQAKAKEYFPNATVFTTGTAAEWTSMQSIIIIGQVKSFFIALLIISLLMSLVFGNFKIGLIGIIPNIFPAIVVGGLMGFLDYPLDIMTVSILPMLLGLAVDDTIHFMNHSQLIFKGQKNYRRVLDKTFTIIGLAILSTSLVLVVNFSAYITSICNMFKHLGILSVAGILAALIADYTITPILIKKFHVYGKEQ